MNKLEFESPKITIVYFLDDAIRTSNDDFGVWNSSWGVTVQ